MKQLVAIICFLFFSHLVSAATLIAQYDFENSSGLGLDSSGYGNDASVVTNIGQIVGHNGTGHAAKFSGGSSRLRIDPLNGYTGYPGFSFTGWMWIDASASGYQGFLSQDQNGECNNRFMVNPALHPFINAHQHSDRALTGYTLEKSAWFHYALVVADSSNGAIAKVYVNGNEVAGSPQIFDRLGSSASFHTYLGAGENGTYYNLQGALDDVCIYEGALTASEVLAMANSSANVPEPSAFIYAFLTIIAITLGKELKRHK